MSQVILLNKPFNVLCQFSGEPQQPTLKDYLDIPGVYPAGRLDKDSEGLVVLTDDGGLQHRISDPKHKQSKAYWVQVEGEIDEISLQALRAGLSLKDGKTRPAEAVSSCADFIAVPPPGRTSSQGIGRICPRRKQARQHQQQAERRKCQDDGGHKALGSP